MEIVTKPLVLLDQPIFPEAMRRLDHVDAVVLPDLRPETYRDIMKRAHVLVVRSGSSIPADMLSDAPNLLGIVRHGAGLDVVPVDTARRLDVAVANVPGGNAQ